MVLSILVALISAPALLGSQEAIRQSQSKEKREEHRARRCNLIATCIKSSPRSREVSGRPVVLRDGKLWIDSRAEDVPPSHPFAGYYLPYPDSKHEGLVTTVTDVAPIMNWVFVDKETHEVKYGVRVDAQPNLTGPFDCTRQDRRLTFSGWEGWCVVEKEAGLWALYFDVDDDGLKSKVAPGTRVLEVELTRKEKRFKKGLDERHQDQTTTRAVDTQENEPIEQSLQAEETVQHPGVHDVQQDDADVPTQQESRPFQIPRSIFENPPPLLASSIFEPPPPPKTPPPAYSPQVEAYVPEQLDPAIAKSLSDFSLSSAAQVKTTSSDKEGPTNLASTPPRLPNPQRHTSQSPDNEKRTTPKLNRSSGTRALAQAQAFEALATAQGTGSNYKRRPSGRLSRSSSNTDSASMYSFDGEVAQENKVESRPPPQNILSSTRLEGQNRQPGKPADREQSSLFPAPIQPKKKPSVQDNALPSKSKPEVSDPAVSGAAQKPQPQNLTRQPSKFSRPSRTNTLPTDPPNASQRTPSRASNSNSTGSPRPPLRRRATGTGSQSSIRTTEMAYRSPRDTSTSSTASERKSLATTMTTGEANRGMTRRVGPGPVTPMGPAGASGTTSTSTSGRTSSPVSAVRKRSDTVPVRGRTVGRKTTSALFREIDELVGQEGGGGDVKRDGAGSGSVEGISGTGPGTGDRRRVGSKLGTRNADGKSVRGERK